MAEFTKGPWEIVRIPDSFTNDKGLYSIEVDDSPWWLSIVGAPAESREIAKANANLISSAPDMYEALYRVKSFLNELRQHHGIYGWSGEKAILDAIAKAEGGEPNA